MDTDTTFLPVDLISACWTSKVQWLKGDFKFLII